MNKNAKMTYAELVNAISAIIPGASFDEDNEGQLVIYTNLSEVKSGEPLVDFEAE